MMMKTKFSRGFTLFELLIVITLIGIIATLALPAMQRSFAQARVENRAMQLANLFRFARSEAMRLNTPVGGCVTGIRSDLRDSGICSHQATYANQAWRLYIDVNRDGRYNLTKNGEKTKTDKDLRTVVINEKDHYRVSITTKLLTLNGNSEQWYALTWLPNGEFAVQTSDGHFQAASAYLRVRVSDADNDAIHRFVIINPMGKVNICEDGTPYEYQNLCQD